MKAMRRTGTPRAREPSCGERRKKEGESSEAEGKSVRKIGR